MFMLQHFKKFIASLLIFVSLHSNTYATENIQSAPAYTPLFLNVYINEHEADDVVLFIQDSEQHIWAKEENLKKWHFNPVNKKPVVYEGQTYYRLDDFQGLQYKIDLANTRLLIGAGAKHFVLNQVNMNEFKPIPVPRPKPGGFLNYDAMVQSNTGQYPLDAPSPNLPMQIIPAQIGGQFEVGFFNHFGVGVSDFLFERSRNSTLEDSSTEVTNKALRLNTTWTYDDPEHMRSLRLGDTYSRPGMWGQSVGFGGIQIASNFSTQPSYITFPLPSTHGEAVVPSTVDLFVNNTLISRQDVNAGPFNIANIPVVTGYGQLNVVTTDLLGRQEVLSLPYYATPLLLRPGLHDYSFEVGFIRKDFGAQSNDYGRFLAVGTDSLGLTDRLTRQIHVEVLNNQQTAGLGVNYSWPNCGIFSVAAAASHNKNNEIGELFQLGYQHQAFNKVSIGGNVLVTSNRFVEVGVNEDRSMPSLQGQAFLGVPLPKGANLNFSYTAQMQRENNNSPCLEEVEFCTPYKASIFSTTYSQTLFKSWSVNVTGLTNVGGQKNQAVFVTLSHYFGNQTSTNIGYNRQTDSADQAAFQLTKTLPVDGGYGYNLYAAPGDPNQYIASVSLQNSIGTYSLQAAKQNSQQGYRAEAAGGIAVLGGHAYLARQVTDSFGVVQVGYPDVRVYNFNQEVGQSDANGNVLIPNLVAYQPNKITIEPTDLPLEAEVNTEKQEVTPYFRSGVLVPFAIKSTRGALMRVINNSNEPIAVGADVTLNGETTQFPVSENGQLYLTNLQANNKVVVHWDNHQCQFAVPYKKSSDPLPDLGTFVCQEART